MPLCFGARIDLRLLLSCLTVGRGVVGSGSNMECRLGLGGVGGAGIGCCGIGVRGAGVCGAGVCGAGVCGAGDGTWGMAGILSRISDLFNCS